jgi:hypothetical protein
MDMHWKRPFPVRNWLLWMTLDILPCVEVPEAFWAGLEKFLQS